MTMTDPIADMLTRLRNANQAYHDSTNMPHSKIKVGIAEILSAQGYIAGFEVLEVFGVANRYPLDYWLTLSPLPERARRVLRHAARRCRLSGLRITANLGNIGIIARRPE